MIVLPNVVVVLSVVVLVIVVCVVEAVIAVQTTDLQGAVVVAPASDGPLEGAWRAKTCATVSALANLNRAGTARFREGGATLDALGRVS